MTAIDPVLDRAPGFFLSFGDDGRIELANSTLLDRLGRSREELIGTHVETILTRAGRLFYQTHVFPLVKMQGRADEIFLPVETRNGEPLGTLWNLVRRTRDDHASIDCILFEVRERRKYEDALLAAKRAAETAKAQIEGQAIQLADQATELEAQQQQLMDQTAELEAQQQQLLEQSAELEAQAEDLRAANEVLVRQAAELERERAAAREAQRAADDANRAKSDFLATMSHELRTPLNAIGGYADLMTAGIYGPLTDGQQQALARLVRAHRHLLGLINDVLNMARIEAGRVEYTIADVRLGDVVNELRAMIEPQIAAGDLTFDVCVADDLVCRADHEKVVQVLLNMLSNAVKFTPKGGTVTLRSRRVDAEQKLAIEVADTGCGIPAAKLDAVFEPFIQVRSDSAPAREGTGLGLAISRNLARGMGGDLSATSEVGKGSTFCLTLPRVEG